MGAPTKPPCLPPFNMHTILYIAVHLIILTVVWRWVYMSQLIHAYKEKCRSTCELLKKDATFAREVAETWPMRSIMFDITHWGLERYIVNQDLYNDMLDELTDEAMKILTKAFKIAADKAGESKEEETTNHDSQ